MAGLLVIVTSVITAVALLGWLEVLLRPAPRRKLATDGRWFTILVLFSAWALINWGALLVGLSSDIPADCVEEQLGRTEQKVTLAEGESKTLPFELK